MKNILIIGAASYVAKEFIKANQNKYNLFGKINNVGALVLNEYKIKVFKTFNELTEIDFDIIINFAYPSGDPIDLHKKNIEIFADIKRQSTDCKVIHISSLAVFGMKLEKDIKPEQVKNRFDYPYVRGKIEMENLLIDAKIKELHIVRLGNVWGPGSEFWTYTLAKKILFNEPVLINSLSGFSNVTYIENIISYIDFLISFEYKPRIYYHHLSEFSYIKWEYWVQNLCNLFNTTPNMIDYTPYYASTILDDLKLICSKISPKYIFKNLLNERFVWVTKTFIRKAIPEIFYNKSIDNNFFPKYNHELIDDNFFNVLTCEREFKSVIDERWANLFTLDEVNKKTAAWLKQVGF